MNFSLTVASLVGICALTSFAETFRTPDGTAFSVSDREIFVNHEKNHRSGHMGHALIDVGGGRLLDFNSNVDGDRCGGHSGFGWMEYHVSTDYGRTWGPTRVLPYTKEWNGDRPPLRCEISLLLVAIAPNLVLRAGTMDVLAGDSCGIHC